MARDNEPYAPDSPKFYMTDAFTDNAVKFIGEYGRKPDPYFLYLAFTSPHWPLHAWPEDIAKYRGKYMKGWDALRRERHERMIAMGIVDRKWPLTPRDPQAPAWETVTDKDERDLRMAVYAAQIDRMDQNIGRVLAKVKELGQEDNTLILFLADNGGCAEEKITARRTRPPGPADSFTSYGLPWANASNTPFRLYKHWVHEGGISTPLIAHWPSVIRKGGGMTQPARPSGRPHGHLPRRGRHAVPEDLQGREVTPLEGKSLLPIFQGRQRAGHEAIYWEHEGNRAVRQGKWKLVSRHPGNWELYDVAADRTEMRDLAGSNPAKVKELAAMYDAWAKRCAVLPWGRG